MARLPLYQRILGQMAEARTPTVSSKGLGEMAGVNAAKVRKDLSFLGSYGTRGAGYDVEYLLTQVGRELGLHREWPLMLVGVGNLGTALANSRGFSSGGFRIAALIDSDPAKTGTVVAGIEVRALGELERLVGDHGIAMAVLTTPAGAAQDVAERLAAAGVTSILNFAPAVLTLADHVLVRQVDLSSELQIMSFHLSHDGVSPGTLGPERVSHAG